MFASEVRLHGIAVRDAELAITPGGMPITEVDVAVHEKHRTVYVPVRCVGDMAKDVVTQKLIREPVLVVGHLWRPPQTKRVPYPPLVVVAHVFRRLKKEETGSLFEESTSNIQHSTSNIQVEQPGEVTTNHTNGTNGKPERVAV